MFQTRTKLFVLSLLASVLVGCTGSETADSERKLAYLSAKPAPIEAQIRWRGILRAANRIEVRADRKLKVKRILVKNFDSVKKGQSIIEIDNSETLTKYNELVDKKKTFDLEMQTARLKHQHTLKILSRKRTLLQKGIIAEKEYDDALRESKVSETEIKTKVLEEQRQVKEMAEVQAQLRAQVFYSPMSGSVSGLISTDSAPNPEAQPGQLLAVVSDMSSLALWVPVEETHIHKVSVGMKARVKLDTLAGEELPGKVLEVGSSAVQNGGRIKTYEVGIGFSVQGQDLREGYSGEAVMTLARKEKVISVPLSALKYSAGKNFVNVSSSESGEGNPREIVLGIKTDTEAEVIRGLSNGDFVVVEAQ